MKIAYDTYIATNDATSVTAHMLPERHHIMSYSRIYLEQAIDIRIFDVAVFYVAIWAYAMERKTRKSLAFCLLPSKILFETYKTNTYR